MVRQCCVLDRWLMTGAKTYVHLKHVLFYHYYCLFVLFLITIKLSVRVWNEQVMLVERQTHTVKGGSVNHKKKVCAMAWRVPKSLSSPASHIIAWFDRPEWSCDTQNLFEPICLKCAFRNQSSNFKFRHVKTRTKMPPQACPLWKRCTAARYECSLLFTESCDTLTSHRHSCQTSFHRRCERTLSFVQMFEAVPD